MAVAPRPNRWPAHATTAVALGLAFWLFVAALTGWVLALERGQSLQQARDTASTLATALEENTARNFESVNLALENMVRLLQQPAGRHDPAVRELLQAQLPRLPAVRALFVVGPDGFIQHDTDYPKTPDVSLADRDYFRQHQQHPALVESISSPLQSRSGAGWFVAVSRRIGTDAEFKGILVAAVQLESLAALYRRLELGQGQVVTLFHRDGRLLARYPPNDEAIGRSFSELPLFRQQLPAGPAGTYSNDGPPLSYPRLISYRALERAPLVVAISLQQAAILAPWRRAAQGAVIALAGLMALVIAGTWLYIQRQQQREQALKEQQAAREAQALARAHAKFRTFFEQGCFFACVMTPDGDVVEANHTGLLACGLSRDEVLGRKFWDGGWWPSPAEVQAIQAGFAQAAAGHPFRTETALRRGAPADTTIELTLSPALDPAGRVLFVAALGMDVTARKRQERMRAAITRRDAGRGGQPERGGQAADAAAAGFQWWGSSSAMRLAGCVGKRSSTSLMYA